MTHQITCKLTGISGPGVKAHIIPESFYGFEKVPARGVLEVMSIRSGDRVAVSRKGEYDSGILTSEGEAYFSECDAYAHRFLVEKKGIVASFYPDHARPEAIQIADFNYRLLKLFFISLLWRAGVSSREFFSNVSLGEDEPVLRNLILRREAAPFNEFGIILWIHKDTPPHGFPILSPLKVILPDGSLPFWEFHLGSFVAWVGMRHSKPSLCDEFYLKENRPVLFLLAESFRDSVLYGKMSEAAKLRESMRTNPRISSVRK